jgi:hypothetical protein
LFFESWHRRPVRVTERVARGARSLQRAGPPEMEGPRFRRMETLKGIPGQSFSGKPMRGGGGKPLPTPGHEDLRRCEPQGRSGGSGWWQHGPGCGRTRIGGESLEGGRCSCSSPWFPRQGGGIVNVMQGAV